MYIFQHECTLYSGNKIVSRSTIEAVQPFFLVPTPSLAPFLE